jgi:drug/metabolite transporter (DMT)-like permease
MAQLGSRRRYVLSPKARRARLWLLAAVVIGLLPILWAMVHHVDKGQQQDWSQTLAAGDVLVLAAALSGGCIYDLLTKPVSQEREDTRNALILSAVIAAIGAMLWFSDMKNNEIEAQQNAKYTLAYLIVTIAVCLRALYLVYDGEVAAAPAAEKVVAADPRPTGHETGGRENA